MVVPADSEWPTGGLSRARISTIVAFVTSKLRSESCPTLVDRVDEYEMEASKERKIVYTRYLIESMLDVLVKHEILIEALGATMRKMEATAS